MKIPITLGINPSSLKQCILAKETLKSDRNSRKYDIFFFAFLAFFAPLFFAKKAKNVNKFFAKNFAKNGRSNGHIPYYAVYKPRLLLCFYSDFSDFTAIEAAMHGARLPVHGPPKIKKLLLRLLFGIRLIHGIIRYFFFGINNWV